MDRPPAPRRVVAAQIHRKVLRRERRARQAVTPRGRTDVEDRIANALRRAARDLLVAQHAETESVDQWIALVAFVEIDLARERGMPKQLP